MTVDDAGVLFVVGLGAIAAIVAAIVVMDGLAALLNRLVGGRPQHELKGAEARVLSWDGREGYVRLEGERWRARADADLAPGEVVRVAGLDGLVLELKTKRGGIARRLGRVLKPADRI